MRSPVFSDPRERSVNFGIRLLDPGPRALIWAVRFEWSRTSKRIDVLGVKAHFNRSGFEHKQLAKNKVPEGKIASRDLLKTFVTPCAL